MQVSAEVTLPSSPALVDDLVATTTVVGVVGAPEFTWTLDGAETDWDGDTVPASALKLGQVWTVETTWANAGNPIADTATTSVDRVGGNLLIVLVDDLGIDKVGAYGVQPDAPPTPTIDALAAEGVLFRNAWVQPTCSPTRAALLTGRTPRRTGIGRWIFPAQEANGLDPDLVILPEIVRQAPVEVADAAVGKWHLSGRLQNPDVALDPLLAGWSSFSGTLANPDNAIDPPDDTPRGYFWFQKSVNGVLAFTEGYLTTDTTDDAIAQVQTLPEPWLLYVAYNAPHSPLHIPPDHFGQ